MGNLILPPSLTRELPYAVTAQLAELPQEAQREFFEEYNRNARTTSIGYVLHLLVFGTHYAYLNQWLLQFIYWFTAGGFGLWMFIDLFRIPSMIANHNSQVADETLRHVLVKYRYRPNPAGRFALRTPYDLQKEQQLEEKPSAKLRSLRPIAPRLLDKPSQDPMYLGISHLKLGCMVDFDLTTWEIVQEWQYDWDNGVSGKEFRMINNKESLHLYRRSEGLETKTIVGKKINIFSIDKELEEEIEENERPPSVLHYENVDYFRENTKTGWRHDLASKNPADKLSAWEYFDESMTLFMRIEQIEHKAYKAVIGEIVSPYEFTNILMKGEEQDKD